MKSKKLKVLDLFSGVGAFSLGLHRTKGFDTVAFCEIDKDCQKVLKKHWPMVPIFEDVTQLKGTTNIPHFTRDYKPLVGNVDLICGGFPCQDISVAGKQKGLTNEEGQITRSGLWFEFKRLIQEIKPKYVIIENVANLRSKGFVTVLQDLWSIGYDTEWNIISARSVGACHLRERIWIIAYPSSERHRRLQSGRRTREDRNEEIRFGGISQTELTSYSDQPRLEEQRKSLRTSKTLTLTPNNSQDTITPNTNNLRLWRSFASEEEKQVRWATSTALLGSVFDQRLAPEPTVRRMDDGLTSGLDTDPGRDRITKRIKAVRKRLEQLRKARIKQLGNSLVPQIPQLIGERILEWEANNK